MTSNERGAFAVGALLGFLAGAGFVTVMLGFLE
jgi:hypothetical protein